MNNIRNKLITNRDILNILIKANKSLYDTKINNIELYQRAFVHKSYITKFEELDNTDNVYEELENYSKCFIIKDSLPEYDSNEKLEFLGDSTLDAIVKEYLYDRFESPRADEGFLTRLKIRLVRSEKLAEFGNYLNLNQLLLLSNKMENLTSKGENKGRNNNRFMEDCFEALIGAIMKDNDINGYYIAKQFVIGLIEKLVDFGDLITNNDNYKDSLLRFFQSKKWGDPKYTDLYFEGAQINRIFVKGVFLPKSIIDKNSLKLLNDYKQKSVKISNKDGINKIKELENNDMILVSLGKGKSKKDAEQNCGKWALTNLKVSWNY